MFNSIMTWASNAWTVGKQLYQKSKPVRETIGGFLGVAEKTGLLGSEPEKPYRVNPAQRIDSSDYMSGSRSVYKAAQTQAANLALTPKVMEKWQSAANSNIPSIRATLKRTPPIPKKGVTIRLS